PPPPHRRTVFNGAPPSRRPYSIERPSLYQRSARTWLFAYSLQKIDRSTPFSSRTFIFRGVEPPDPSRPTGLMSRIVKPSCSLIAALIASPRLPVTSRCADLP